MFKYLMLVLAIVLFPAILSAENGVIIEVQGSVSITAPSGGSKLAEAGSLFPHGSKIETAKKSGAVILFKNGAVRRLGSNEKIFASGSTSGDILLFKEMIDIDAARSADKGELGGSKKKKAPIDPRTINEKALKNDLSRVEGYRMATVEGRTLLKGEILFKYRKYNDVISTLETTCQPSSCQNEAARNLLKGSFVKTGDFKKAAQY